MKKMIILIMNLIVVCITFTGCISRFFSVGEEKSKCSELGCDYTDVGVCAGPLQVLQNKNNINDLKKGVE